MFSFGTFVHLDYDGVDQYFKEIHRILKPSGVATIQYADTTKDIFSKQWQCELQHIF